ncbi:MAG: hypothetical protein LUG95_01505 [Clostridiales bacterium]|nr:hypothetical protein [Clostridiales bacterium]
MSYSYGKLSSAQRSANIHSFSAVKSHEGILVSVALTRRGGICYNFAALTKNALRKSRL